MVSVDVREAKDRMAGLINRAIAGKEVIITRRGKQVVRFEALSAEKRVRLLLSAA